jgi:hypothetical protein
LPGGSFFVNAARQTLRAPNMRRFQGLDRMVMTTDEAGPRGR